MVEVRRMGLALNLVSPQPQEVNILLVQDLTLLISCQGMAVSLQSLGGGQGGSTAAAGVCHWGSSWPCAVPTGPCAAWQCLHATICLYSD